VRNRFTTLLEPASRAPADQGPVREQAATRSMGLTFCHLPVPKCHMLNNTPVRAEFIEFMIQIKRAAF
jgi:hypothetical protein